MKTKNNSHFIDVEERNKFFKDWTRKLEHQNNTWYKRVDVNTFLGKTVVWSINDLHDDVEAIVIFPGFRTSSLFWDMDNALACLKGRYKIYLVETNGQPNLSDGTTPEIRSEDYGTWALEVIEGLGLDKVTVAGASFGALVCLKLCIVAPERVNKAILLNPGCLQPFSLTWKNIFYNMLPILFPSKKNVDSFLDKAVLNGNAHNLSAEARGLMTDYEMFALKRFRDNTQKPYAMSEEELSLVMTDIYLILGKNDILFPWKNSWKAAKRFLKTCKNKIAFPEIGHGIETTRQGIEAIASIMDENRKGNSQSLKPIMV